MMKIAIGSDHAGYEYKEILKLKLIEWGYEPIDLGTDSAESVDYPQYIFPVAKAVAAGEYERGIVLGGSGNGEAICANRVKGIRCALCWNIQSAKFARQHNNANLISIGERLTSKEDAIAIVRTWLDTEFEGGRHQRRIDMLDQD